MSLVFATKSKLTAIANAIRTRAGSVASMTLDDMADAIPALPNTYAAGDEGKVVDNGTLVSQTSDTVTENDTYDTTLINSLTVNVSGGGGTEIDTAGEYSVAEDATITVGNGLNGLINVVKEKTLLYNWDFTTSLTDTVEGISATLANGATQSSSGVTIAGETQHIKIPINFRLGHTYELDIASMNKEFTSGHGRLFMINNSEGFAKQNGSSWKWYSDGMWSISGGSADFSTATLRFTFGRTFNVYGDSQTVKRSPATIYNNNVLYLRSDNTCQSSSNTVNITIGGTSASFYTMVITGFRIYEGVDMALYN